MAAMKSQTARMDIPPNALLDNIASRQYQHDVRPLRLALDRWLRELGFQDAGLSIRLVKASDLPPNACGMSNYDVQTSSVRLTSCGVMSM